MDPVSALALSCNIIEIVDRAINCGQAIKELYGSASGFTKDLEKLAEVASAFEATVARLHRVEAQLEISPERKQVQRVISICESVANEARDVLNKCEAKKKGSLRSATGAAIQTLLRASKIQKLQAELDQCWAILSYVLAENTQSGIKRLVEQLESARMHQSDALKMFQTEVLQKLNTLDLRIQDSVLTQEMSQRIDGLRLRIDKAVPTYELQEQIKALMDLSQAGAETMNQAAILEALYFQAVDERFHDIHEAAPETFEWIISNPHKLDHSERLLASWLETGSGIFHISGKPGAGKSTLVKLLYGHPETTRLLSTWAGDRQLLLSSYFFWRVGSAYERSLRGLVRGLVYGVLKNAPKVSKSLFPQYWRSGSSEKMFHFRVDLTESEINDAFDRLIQNSEIFDKFRICFFVDGLDEFDESHHVSFYALARKLQTWTDNCPNIKICVSSREIPSFAKVFSTPSRLTLHKITQRDIAALVRSKLAHNIYFIELRKTHEERCGQLIDRIIKDAEGVFLWVALLLKLLEDALANDDSMAMLETIVSSAPRELDQFIEAIVDTIPPAYCRGAYLVLAVTMRMAGMLISNDGRTPEHKMFDSVKYPPWIPANMFASLFSCYFIFEQSDTSNPASYPYGGSEFTSSGDIGDASTQAITQVAARCRGLLEVTDDRCWVKYTHRSIPEFLQKYFAHNPEKHGLNDTRVAEVLVWSTHAEIVFLGQTIFRRATSVQPFAWRLLHLVARLRQIALNTETVFRLLHALEESLLLLQFGTQNPTDDEWESAYIIEMESFARLGRITILNFAAFLGLYEFLEWEFKHHLTFSKDRNRILNMLCSTAIWSVMKNDAFADPTLEAIFRCGVPVTSVFSPRAPQWWAGRYVWYQYLENAIFKKHQWRHQRMQTPPYKWRSVATWLRFGAEAEIQVSIDPSSGILQVTGSDGDIVHEESGWGQGYTVGSVTRDFLELRRWRLSLGDFTRLYHPDNMDEILRHIETNSGVLGSQVQPQLPTPLWPDGSSVGVNVALAQVSVGRATEDGEKSESPGVLHNLWTQCAGLFLNYVSPLGLLLGVLAGYLLSKLV